MTETPSVTTGYFQIDHYLVDMGDNTISVEQQCLHIEPKAMHVLYVLACHAGETVSREQLMQEVWGDRVVVEDALTRTISKLRTAFGDNKAKQLIQTIPKKGYRLKSTVQWQPDAQEDPKATALPSSKNAQEERVEDKSIFALRHRKTLAVGSFFALVGSVIVVYLMLFLGTEKDTSNLKSSLAEPTSISLALLPLKNLTGDKQAGYLADGILEEIAGTLANTSMLNVKSRYATYIYARQNKQLEEIARLLNTQFLLEGSVRESGDQYLIVVRLIDAESERTIWSSRYENSMSQLYDIQEDIADKIRQLLVPDSDNRQNDNTSNIAARQDVVAYQHYLKGLYWLMHGKTSQWFYLAEDAFLDAIERDPMFAAAHGRLAYIYARHDYHDVYMDKDLATEKAIASIDQALTLDPNEINAHLARAILATTTGEFELAEQSLNLVLTQQRQHTTALYLFSEMALAKNDFSGALNYAEQALKLDPLSPWINVNLAIIHYWKGDYEAALAALDTAISVDAEYTWAWVWRAKIFQVQGKTNNAIASMETCLELDPDSAINSAWLGILYFEANQKELANRWLKHTASLYGDTDDARFFNGFTRFAEQRHNTDIVQRLLSQLTLLDNPLFSLTHMLVSLTTQESQLSGAQELLKKELLLGPVNVDGEQSFFINVHNLKRAKALVKLAAKFNLPKNETLVAQIQALEEQLPNAFIAQTERSINSAPYDD
ncbi:tetratricopeptide repeat protein [Alteromonas sp. S005]|uniref:tetratricopeptide repeat protein n=1 Tax=Alteromonas sp. S005 TaxID=3117400 RepID=UPI002FE3216A